MPIDIVNFLIECGNGFIEGTQTVVGFNYKIVTALLNIAADSYSVLASLTADVLNVSKEIGFYLWELLCELYNLGSAFWKVLGKIAILIAHVWFIIWNGIEITAEYIASSILSGFKLTYFCVLSTCDYAGLSTKNVWSVIKSTSNWIAEWMYYTATVIGSNCKHFMKSLKYGIQNIIHYLVDIFLQIDDFILYVHDKIINHIPADFFFCFLLGICMVSLVLLIIKQMNLKGFTLPSIQIVSITESERNIYNRDDDIIISDEEDFALDEYNEDRVTTSSRVTGSTTSTASHTDSISEDDFSSTEDVDEFEVVTDSSEEYSDENNENNQNTINIQLPARTGRKVLRSQLMCNSDNILTPDDLQKKLETEQERKLCVVCQDLPKCVLVLPCRHMCMCVECAHEMVNQRNRQRRNCPLCRSAIQTVMNVYV